MGDDAKGITQVDAITDLADAVETLSARVAELIDEIQVTRLSKLKPSMFQRVVSAWGG